MSFTSKFVVDPPASCLTHEEREIVLQMARDDPHDKRAMTVCKHAKLLDAACKTYTDGRVTPYEADKFVDMHRQNGRGEHADALMCKLQHVLAWPLETEFFREEDMIKNGRKAMRKADKTRAHRTFVHVSSVGETDACRDDFPLNNMCLDTGDSEAARYGSWKRRMMFHLALVLILPWLPDITRVELLECIGGWVVYHVINMVLSVGLVVGWCNPRVFPLGPVAYAFQFQMFVSHVLCLPHRHVLGCGVKVAIAAFVPATFQMMDSLYRVPSWMYRNHGYLSRTRDAAE